VLALPESAFAKAGVSRQKARYLRALAEIVRDDPRFFDRLPRLSDEAAIERLTAILGVGRWTAEMYLIFCLGRLDVLPLGDVSIHAAAADVHGLRRSGAAQAIDEIGQAVAPLPERRGLVPLRAPRCEPCRRLSGLGYWPFGSDQCVLW
jgi:DNA-3-methyladenine glycosylase II